jgi:hypothetical protein
MEVGEKSHALVLSLQLLNPRIGDLQLALELVMRLRECRREHALCVCVKRKSDSGGSPRTVVTWSYFSLIARNLRISSALTTLEPGNGNTHLALYRVLRCAVYRHPTKAISPRNRTKRRKTHPLLIRALFVRSLWSEWEGERGGGRGARVH